MGRCSRVTNPRRKLCSGDMRNPIQIQERVLLPAEPGQTAPTVGFTTVRSPRAMIMTTDDTGVARFAGVNIAEGATHLFLIRRSPGAAKEEAGNMFVLFKARRFRILRVNFPDEDPYIVMLQCTERGDDSQAGSSA